jgi:S-adenosylmethionine synthetase
MLAIKQMDSLPVQYKDVEIVERKGLAHPDTLIDGIVEEVSKNLCKEYLNTFGFIAHHNVDKGLIVGGKSEVTFRGGKIIKKPLIYITGRATEEVEGKKINVEEIALNAAKSYLKKIRNADVENDFEYVVKLREGSKDLTELFRRSKVPLANDTSFGVSYAPLSNLEKTVKHVEQFLNSEKIKKQYPFVGEDIKVMGYRYSEKVGLTVAIAFVSKYIDDLEDYWRKKEKIEKIVKKEAEKVYGDEVEVKVNTADKGDSIYLTVIGSSIEAGDDGSVGRGNRVNGLITPFRPMTLEAAAGKNPVSHVGKLYSICSLLIANDIYNEISVPVNVYMLSRIGEKITNPRLVIVETYGKIMNEGKIKDIVGYHVEMLPELTYQIIEGKVAVVY